MPTCYLDDRPLPITLTETPMATEWLDRYAGETLHINTPYDATTVNTLHELINRHRPLFTKLRLAFLTDVTTREELMHQPRLADIHSGIVDLQKRHTGITDILARNTQGGWENIHEHIHLLESQISRTMIAFSRTPGLDHANTDTAPAWQWHEQFTAEQWRASTSFDTSHITMATAELGRTPYEAFQFAPDRWHTEGSITGTLSPRLELRTRRAPHRADPGYEQWCEKQGIPVIGEHLPLANFQDEGYLDLIPTVTRLRIET